MRPVVKRRDLVFLLLTAAFWTEMSATAEKTGTFVITIALPTPTIHAGDVLIIEETISNPTDHVAVAGSGIGGGSMVELLNERGEDLGQHAMGSAAIKIPDANTPVLHVSAGKVLGPGTSAKAVWHYTPDSGSLVPGTYRLRTHIRDMNSGADVYSNTVVLTVLP
jgi:hypothetical protein